MRGARMAFLTTYSHWIFIFADPQKDESWFPRSESAERNECDRMFLSSPFIIEKPKDGESLAADSPVLQALLHALLLSVMQGATNAKEYFPPMWREKWDELYHALCHGFPDSWALQATPAAELAPDQSMDVQMVRHLLETLVASRF